MRATSVPGGRRRAPGRCAARIEQHERDAERERLLDHHHHRGETLVGERGETEEALRLLGVRVVEHLRAERDHVGEDLPRPEEQRRVARALAHASGGGDRSGRRSATRRGGRRGRSSGARGCARPDSRARSRTAAARAIRRGRPATRRSSPTGVSRNASVRRTQRVCASGTSSPRGRKKTASGPRTATSVSATPRSATSTCWSMCTDCRYSSPTVSIGPTSAKTVIATPAQKRTARLHGARSGRPRARSRWKPWKKKTSATTAPASTSGESVQVVHGLAARRVTRAG